MKRPCQKYVLVALAHALSGVIQARAQGNFQNLNFEAASIPVGTPPGTTISAGAAIPGWSASPYVVYDGFSGGGAEVSINDTNTPVVGFSPLQGKYSVILFAGPDGPGNSSSISQTGFVPANARSIQMDLAFPYGMIASAPFVVFGTTV